MDKRAVTIGSKEYNYVLYFLAALKVILHFYVNCKDQFFRDELYYIACANHLAFGYVDHSPLIAYITFLSQTLFGESLFAYRIFPVMAGVLQILLTGYLVRELGGNRFSQNLAALCVFMAPTYIALNSTLSMNAFDQVFWLGAVCLLVHLIKNEKPALWMYLGVVLGIGLMNKISVLFLGMGMAVGIVLTPNRQWLKERWIWICAGISMLLFLPYIIWEIKHGWPTLEFIHNASTNKNKSYTPGQFIWIQIMMMNPFLCPVWLTGLVAFFYDRTNKRMQLFGWIYIAVLILLIAQNGKSYYLAPVYTFLFARGVIAIEDGITRLRWSWLKPALCTFIVIAGAISIPMAIPVLPVETYLQYTKMLGQKPGSDEKQKLGKLPQFYADRYGWPELAKTVADVYQQLSADEKKKCAILAGNYGEAGAIDFFGKQYGLSKALCIHNNYHYWGPGEATGDLMIIVGVGYNRLKDNFAEIKEMARTHSEYAMPYESDMPVYIARNSKLPLREVWPMLKSYN